MLSNEGPQFFGAVSMSANDGLVRFSTARCAVKAPGVWAYQGPHLSWWCATFSCVTQVTPVLQGYLAHKKTPTPLGPP